MIPLENSKSHFPNRIHPTHRQNKKSVLMKIQIPVGRYSDRLHSFLSQQFLYFAVISPYNTKYGLSNEILAL